jgi:4-amino-4-deoxy-L-arabinose transferase-like glycosyltransferase
LILLLMGSVGLYVWGFDSFQVGTAVDDAHYIILARSLLDGEDYGLIHPPDQVLPTRYPFGWPLLLLPVYALSDGSFEWLKALPLLFTVANTLLIALGWRGLGLSSRSLGLAAAALYALSPPAVYQASMVMSEPAFLFFVLLGLVLTPSPRHQGRRALVGSVGLGIAWLFGAYVRTIGFVLVAASALLLILGRDWRRLIAATLACAVAMALVVAITPLDARDLVTFGEYADQFQDPGAWGQEGAPGGLLARVGSGLAGYLGQHVRDSVLPFIGGPTTAALLGQARLGFVPALASLSVLALLVLGYAASLRRHGLLAVHVFVPAYLVVLLLWPWQGIRLLYGVLPLLFAYLLLGGQALERLLVKLARGRERLSSWVPRLAVAAVAVLIGAQLLRSVWIDDSLDHVRDFRIGSDWIRENAEVDAVVVAELPEIVYLYAQRSTVGLPSDVAELNRLAAGASPCYVLLAPQLAWSVTGELEHSAATGALLEAFDSGLLSGELVFEDRAAMVQVISLSDSRVSLALAMASSSSGKTPSCCQSHSRSLMSHTSTILPSATRKMLMPELVTCLPVVGRPPRSP